MSVDLLAQGVLDDRLSTWELYRLSGYLKPFLVILPAWPQAGGECTYSLRLTHKELDALWRAFGAALQAFPTPEEIERVLAAAMAAPRWRKLLRFKHAWLALLGR